MLSFEDAHHGRQDYGIASFLLQIFRPHALRRSAKADWLTGFKSTFPGAQEKRCTLKLIWSSVSSRQWGPTWVVAWAARESGVIRNYQRHRCTMHGPGTHYYSGEEHRRSISLMINTLHILVDHTNPSTQCNKVWLWTSNRYSYAPKQQASGTQVDKSTTWDFRLGERKCYLCARVVGEKALLASSQAASPHCTGGTRHLPPRRPRSNCSGSSGSLQVQSREPAGAVLGRAPPTIWTPRHRVHSSASCFRAPPPTATAGSFHSSTWMSQLMLSHPSEDCPSIEPSKLPQISGVCYRIRFSKLLQANCLPGN